MKISNDPIHITVVGHKDDPTAQALFQTGARLSPSAYKRVEWWDTREGRLPNPDVQYPELKNAGALHLHQQHLLGARSTNQTRSAPK